MARLAAMFCAVWLVAGCAGGAGGARWSADQWLRQGAQDVEGGRGWRFSAAPLGDDGFKLKLTLRTDGLFRGAGGEAAPDMAAYEAAAKAAAPVGCTLRGVALAADGGAVADYDCGG